jgi:hypothetical protein
VSTIWNESKGSVVASEARIVSNWWGRLRGLLGEKSLAPGAAMVLSPCDSIHMFGMRFPLDVLFADSDGVVVGVIENIRPWRMTKRYRTAVCAVELPVGAIADSNTEQGDALRFEK